MKSIMGRWRIVEMEQWDAEAIDLVAPAAIVFERRREGQFGFIAVEGWLDWRRSEGAAPPKVEFSWEGNDEGDHVCGRGWAELQADGSMQGRIFFHGGDDSGFRAVRTEEEATPST